MSGSVELAAGCFAGGFLIDFDHYLDYLLFEGQWRRPQLSRFLSYYFMDKARYLVLPLHSYELMSILTVVAVMWRSQLLIGYLLGAAMHLAFDIAINGDYVLRRRFLFYLFSYRAYHGFATNCFLDSSPAKPGTGSRPYREFFAWRPPFKKLRRTNSSAANDPGWQTNEDS